MSNILFMDMETSGLDPFKNGITELAFEMHKDGKCVSKFHKKIRMSPQSQPTVDVNALAVNGQTVKGLLTEGEPEDLVAIELVDWLVGLGEKWITVGGHNVHFDLHFLKVFMQRFKIEGITQILSSKTADTGTLMTALKAAGKIPEDVKNLGQLATHLNIDLEEGEELHTAAADTRITAECYYKMVDMLKA